MPEFSVQHIADATFVKMQSTPPEAQEQARLLLNAMKAKLSGGTYMEVEEINKKYVKITGAVKDMGDQKSTAIVGRFGEVVVFEGVNAYLELPQIKQRYGMHIIQGSATALIPADSHKAAQTKDYIEGMLRPMEIQIQDKAFAEWKSKFPDTKSVPDFFMANAHPLEIKSKLNSYVFISESGSKRYEPANPRELTAGNEHIRMMGASGGKLIVGGVWVDTIWSDITENLQPVKKLTKSVIKNLQRKETRIREKTGVAVKYDWTLPKGQGKGGEGKLFQMVGLRLSAFIPMVADEKAIERIIKSKYVLRSDMGALKASSAWTADLLQELINRYVSSIS